MEENMQAVGSILGNLKNMAQDMGDEIGKQNKDLERIGGKVTIFILFICFFCLFLVLNFISWASDRYLFFNVYLYD